MRGADEMQEALFSFSKLEDFVPGDHPLRAVRQLVDEALKRLNGLFNAIYADTGRASIAPEKLMRALLLQVLYSVRSERQLVEQIHYNMLFRWFVGLAMEDRVWDHSVFSKNRDRLLEHGKSPRSPVLMCSVGAGIVAGCVYAEGMDGRRVAEEGQPAGS